MENSRKDLLTDLGFLELVLTEAVTDKDVLLSISHLLQQYPQGSWPIPAVHLINQLNAAITGFLVDNMNE